MRILLPTGSATVEIVKKAAEGMDAAVVVTGEIASFLTPAHLERLLCEGRYDLVLVSGMCTASFTEIEQRTGVPIYRGPRHAADLAGILPLLGKVSFSRTIPADDLLVSERLAEAMGTVARKEEEAEAEYLIRGVKIGGNSRMKVLAEIMDAHREEDIRTKALLYFSSGADIVDLGFGFDATPDDVKRVFSALEDLPGPLAIDTQDPVLIAGGLIRADLVLSLSDQNIAQVGSLVARCGAGAVVVPGQRSLEENIRLAESAGISCIIADPLIAPVGSGLVPSLMRFRDTGYPLFFGAGNVAELLDADSTGVNALLAGMAMEANASVLFTSEHSDKTRGSVREMRRATEMMVLAAERPYPKDLGIDLLVLKEKRRRREPPLHYREEIPAREMPQEITYDPCGNFRIGIEGNEIVAEINGRAYRGSSWAGIFSALQERGEVSRLDHAAYLGAELYKAELAIRFGRSFEQDGPF
jgi:dihydropteroate synthase-like protein